MCHSRGLFFETTKKNTKQQVVAYNGQQWNLFSQLMVEVFKEKNYGEHFEYLLSELREGPYWHLVKARLTQPQEYGPSESVSGSRSPQPEDNSSSSEEWEYASDLLTKN